MSDNDAPSPSVFLSLSLYYSISFSVSVTLSVSLFDLSSAVSLSKCFSLSLSLRFLSLYFCLYFLISSLYLYPPVSNFSSPLLSSPLLFPLPAQQKHALSITKETSIEKIWRNPSRLQLEAAKLKNILTDSKIDEFFLERKQALLLIYGYDKCDSFEVKIKYMLL